MSTSIPLVRIWICSLISTLSALADIIVQDMKLLRKLRLPLQVEMVKNEGRWHNVSITCYIVSSLHAMPLILK